MNRISESLNNRIEKLHMKNAAGNLDLLGKIFVDNRKLSLWEHDTLTLPRPARKWRRKARAFAQEYIRPVAAGADINPDGLDSKHILRQAARQGFLSLMLVPPLGRANYSLFFKNPAYLLGIVAEEFCTECGGIGLILLAHNLGVVPLMLSGHIPTYIRHVFPFYFKSTWLGDPRCMAFAITEPGAGSDVEETEGGATAKLVTTAKSVKGGYLLNGTKCFISGGAIADKITVFAKLEGQGLESWKCFLVENKMKGFIVGRHEKKMGQRASDASELIFDNVFVPDKNVIGKPASGWPLNRNVLNYSRPVVGAMALGHGRGAFERALDFCQNTYLGQKKLVEYQDVQIELADMMTTLSAARSLIWHSTGKFWCNQASSSTAKIFASDTAFKVCNQAMELVGDHSYIHSNGIERSMRDARLTQIYEGTNQINRLAIIEHLWDAEINKISGGSYEPEK